MQRSFPKIHTQISDTPTPATQLLSIRKKISANQLFDRPQMYFSTDDASPIHDFEFFGKDILNLEEPILDPVCELNRQISYQSFAAERMLARR
jgi:hypothetical protein